MSVDFDLSTAFAVFDQQDSGCVSYGIEAGGERRFVKTPTTPAAVESLTRAVAFHAAVRHHAIVAPIEIIEDAAGPILVYPWHDGTVLNQATSIGGPDRSALERFRQRPVVEVERALDRILDAHLAVAAAGFVAVDLYDGCFLYDFDAVTMRLVDLDEYRPGPFVLDADRLPGSRRYMAPEEFERGAVIDERTTVFDLGCALHHLLDSSDGWRGTPTQGDIVARATQPERGARYASVAELVDRWTHA